MSQLQDLLSATAYIIAFSRYDHYMSEFKVKRQSSRPIKTELCPHCNEQTEFKKHYRNRVYQDSGLVLKHIYPVRICQRCGGYDPAPGMLEEYSETKGGVNVSESITEVVAEPVSQPEPNAENEIGETDQSDRGGG